MSKPKLSHLEETFAIAERTHPDLMERYSGRLAEAQSSSERIAIMEAGLRETFRERYPMPEGCRWPGDTHLPTDTIVPRSQSSSESKSARQPDLCPLSRLSTAESG